MHPTPEHVTAAASAAWDTMATHGMLPTPRNFEVWFSYYLKEKPRLNERINRLESRSRRLTPEVMDSLYEDFFAAPAELGFVADKSRQLRALAVGLVDRLTADQGTITNYSAILDAATSVLETTPAAQQTATTIRALRRATDGAGERMSALEQLFAASVVRINQLTEDLARTEKEASCDPLTGLANRRGFEMALSRDAAQAASDRFALALLLLDIDHFKDFNDTHGHVMGDRLLQFVAQLLTRNIKGRDTAARYGGEEFAVILVQAGASAAAKVANQIRVLLSAKPLAHRSKDQVLGVVTCSIGVAVFRPGEDLTDFIDRADRALYEAKNTGRNRVVTEDEVEALDLSCGRHAHHPTGCCD
jgi:diguanylate cyclase